MGQQQFDYTLNEQAGSFVISDDELYDFAFQLVGWFAKATEDFAKTLPPDPPPAPFFITTPATPIVDAKGGVVWFDANGYVFRNGAKLGTARVQGMALNGDEIFGQAFTASADGRHYWYRWTGAVWQVVLETDPAWLP